jgi:cobalt/nickel transport system permease protein
MENNTPAYLLRNEPEHYELSKIKPSKLTFIDQTLLNSAKALKSVYLQADNSVNKTFIHKINPYVKVFSLIYMALIISLISNLLAQALAAVLIVALYFFSGIKVSNVYRKVFIIAFVFGFLVVFPASLNIITPGRIVLNLITFSKPSHFWIYHIPQQIGLTTNGLRVVLLFFLRVLNSVSFVFLIGFTTPFQSFIKSFKIVGLPDSFLMIIMLAYKYIFILSRTIEETCFALKSRLSGSIRNKKLRKLIGGRIFFIFKRATVIYENTYYAMVSRGYQGEIKLDIHNFFTYKDIIAVATIILSGIALLLI